MFFIRTCCASEDRKDQSGFSLLELLLVVGVGALLLLAGIATYRLVTQGNNVNDAIRILATVKQQTQRAFQGQRDYGTAGTAGAGALNATLVAMEAFPAGVVNGADQPQHPWGGNIMVDSNGQSFFIDFVGIPTDACIQLGTTFDQDDTDFIGLTVGTTKFNTGTPVSVSAMTTACAGGPVNMVWEFY